MIKFKRIQSGVRQHFMRAYLGALVFAAAIITVVLVSVAKNSITQMEIGAMQSALSLMAADVQQQCEIMNGVYKRILTDDQYAPSVLRKDKYNEIEMLENFATYVNYSPVSDSLFLMYDHEDMVYLSTREKALLKYHCQSKYGFTDEESEKLRQELLSLQEIRLINTQYRGGKAYILFAVPISFTKNLASEKAVLVFEAESARLQERLESVMGYSFENYAIYQQGECCLEVGGIVNLIPENFCAGAGQTLYRNLKANSYLISATSSDGRFTIYAQGEDHAFDRAVSAYVGQIGIFIILLTIVFLLFAFGAASRSSRPIRKLAQQFGEPDEKSGFNEFNILESAIQKIESDHKTSVRKAREQFLQLLLHGNCNGRMLEQWAQLGVSFEFSNNCVYLISAPENSEALIEEIEGFSDSHTRVYAMQPREENNVVVCCSYQYDITRSELYENLCALVDDKREKVFMGESYDTPLKISLSWHEAKQAWQTEHHYSRQLGLSYDQANQRLETIRTAIKCGRVDVVEAEIEALGRVLAEADDSVALQKYIYHSLLSCMVNYFRENRKENMTRTLESLLVSDFRLFAAEFVKTMRENQPVRDSDNSSVARDILRYIEQNAQDCDLCLDSLVDEFALNADYISQLVKSQTGIAFKEYLIRLRMQIAQKLLLEYPDWTVNDVAVHSGYRTASNFIKRFRETTGMTPLQFRNSRSIQEKAVPLQEEKNG